MNANFEIEFLAILASAVVILFSSRLVYRELHAIADAIALPPFFIASLLLALSTSVPELFIGVTSALRGTPAFGLGNIIGANIIGLSFITGLILLVGRSRLELSRHIAQSRFVLTFGISMVPVLMLFDGELSRLDGVILLTLYILYVLFSLYIGRRRNERTFEVPKRAAAHAFLLFLFGVLCLVAASEFLYVSANSLGATLGFTPFVVGIFVLSFATALPEISFGLRSAFDSHPELLVADIIGSSAVNFCGILGLTAVIAPIVPKDLTVVIIDGLFYIALVLFFYLILWNKQASRIRGSALLLVYGAFAVLNFILR